MRLTLESIGDGVIVTDAKERVTLLNQVSADLTGFCMAALSVRVFFR